MKTGSAAADLLMISVSGLQTASELSLRVLTPL